MAAHKSWAEAPGEDGVHSHFQPRNGTLAIRASRPGRQDERERRAGLRCKHPPRNLIGAETQRSRLIDGEVLRIGKSLNAVDVWNVYNEAVQPARALWFEPLNKRALRLLHPDAAIVPIDVFDFHGSSVGFFVTGYSADQEAVQPVLDRLPVVAKYGAHVGGLGFDRWNRRQCWRDGTGLGGGDRARCQAQEFEKASAICHASKNCIYGMATPTPWQLTRPSLPTVRKREVFAYDPYNFGSTSTTQGTDSPAVRIPATGPHAAGAVPPTKWPSVITVEVVITGSIGPEYGVNTHQS